MEFVRIVMLLLVGLISFTMGQSVSNVETVTDCSCDHRYFKHYEAKRCKPVYEDFKTCQCPKRFECDTLVLNPNVCELNGITYQVGDKVNSSNNCQICNCRKHYATGIATIDCIGIECPHHFRRPTYGCFLQYETGKCCPTEKCATEDTDKNKKEDLKVCTYNGKDFAIGQKIYPEEDPCLTCFCTENWTGVNNDSCKSFNCELEKEIQKLKNGCIPIYHEKTCCPIEYHCLPSDNETTIVENTTPQDGKCYYKGRNYGIGEILDINHPTNCVSCQCQVPPDFTCIHRSCRPPPNNDYENCVPNFKPNACCAEYNCTVVKDTKPSCPVVNCPDNPFCKEVTQPDGCPKCECLPLCSPPKCDDGCTLQTSVPEGQCPGCDCP